MSATTDRNGDGAISNMTIVSHMDDDLLFMNPDIRDTIASGAAQTTVFLTAGDAGRNESYWSGRETGIRAAYGEMAGAQDWVDEIVTVGSGSSEFNIVSTYLASEPQVRLYFMRLPDGMSQGTGSALYDRTSLQRLWNGDIDSAGTVDAANDYSRLDLIRVLGTLIESHQADRVMMQDHESRFASRDHSDHVNASWFAAAAAAYTGTEADGYVGYGQSSLPANLDSATADQNRDTFLEYMVHDDVFDGQRDAEGNPTVSARYESWMHRQYLTEDFLASDPGDWSTDRNMRVTGDMNGDGVADLVAFGDYGVDVTASMDDGFHGAERWISNFSYYNGGWRLARHERAVGDVDGDGRDDVVGFGTSGVLVARSTGDGLQSLGYWSRDFDSDSGWDSVRHERRLADVNGDVRDDIVGFGSGGVEVALSNGRGFGPAQLWIRDFGYDRGGWRTDRHERLLADVNGDGREDVVGFGSAGVLVSLSTGTGFQQAQLWVRDFGYYAGGWRANLHERAVADVNGDGLADVVGFGTSGVLVSLSTGDGFQRAQLWLGEFGTRSGWNATDHDRQLADVNGDGLADIVAYGEDGLMVALSDGDSFDIVDPLLVLTGSLEADPLLLA